jgi:S-DNA-T family DNA segregation ATPase FtsK/SpoIIIE
LGQGLGHGFGHGGIARSLGLVVVLVGWAFVVASLIGFDAADAPGHAVWPGNEPVANWCGPLGASIAYALLKVMGLGAWVVVLASGVGLMMALCGSRPTHWPLRLVGVAMLGVAVSGMQQIVAPGSGSYPGLAGGLVGVVGVEELTARVGAMGAFLGVLLMGLIGLVVAADEWVAMACGWGWAWARTRGVPVAKDVGAAAVGVAGAAAVKASGGVWSRVRGMLGLDRAKKKRAKVRVDDLDDAVAAEEKADVLVRAAEAGKRSRGKGAKAGAEREARGDGLAAAEVAVLEAAVVADSDADEARADEDGAGDEAREGAGGGAGGGGGAQVEVKPRRGAEKAAEVAAEEEDDDVPGAPQVFSDDQLRAKVDRLPIFFGTAQKAVASQAELEGLQNAAGETTTEGKQYRFPGLDLLEEPEANFNAKLEEYVREQAGALVAALQQFRIDGQVDSVESGPVITLFHVRLSPGTKVAALEAVSKDIARVLKAQNVRIVSNTPGRDTVGIEVPNLHKEKVRMKELMAKTERYGSMKLPLFLGKDASGEALIEDLAKMPHVLIAGTTGSGKSVCMNTIIMGFLYTKKPSELKMVLVDPKMVEMSQFKDIPHLMCPVVTEMGKAAAILEWATLKMDERYELLAEAGCRDIAAYNDLEWDELKERMGAKTEEEASRIPRKLPYMVFIIDELADLMMTNKEVESYIIRIAQKARAVGIHLILATQRPQANVVTGLIKSNMPCRIAFKVASGMDSRIVLDQKGGELLLGHGDMLFLSPRSSKLTRAQGTLVDDLEIRRVVRFMRDVAGPSFERQLVQLRAGGAGAAGATDALDDDAKILQSQNNSSASLAAAQEDPMFPRAVEIVLETRRGSVSLLQRRLAIGYTRASRLIDLMGIAGIISDHKGSVARDVLITIEDWQAMKRLAQEQGSTLLETGGPLDVGGGPSGGMGSVAGAAGGATLFGGGASGGGGADALDEEVDEDGDAESEDGGEDDGEEVAEDEAEVVDGVDEDEVDDEAAGEDEEDGDEEVVDEEMMAAELEEAEEEVEEEVEEEEAPPFEPTPGGRGGSGGGGRRGGGGNRGGPGGGAGGGAGGGRRA